MGYLLGGCGGWRLRPLNIFECQTRNKPAKDIDACLGARSKHCCIDKSVGCFMAFDPWLGAKNDMCDNLVWSNACVFKMPLPCMLLPDVYQTQGSWHHIENQITYHVWWWPIPPLEVLWNLTGVTSSQHFFLGHSSTQCVLTLQETSIAMENHWNLPFFPGTSSIRLIYPWSWLAQGISSQPCDPRGCACFLLRWDMHCANRSLATLDAQMSVERVLLTSTPPHFGARRSSDWAPLCLNHPGLPWKRRGIRWVT